MIPIWFPTWDGREITLLPCCHWAHATDADLVFASSRELLPKETSPVNDGAFKRLKRNDIWWSKQPTYAEIGDLAG